MQITGSKVCALHKLQARYSLVCFQECSTLLFSWARNGSPWSVLVHSRSRVKVPGWLFQAVSEEHGAPGTCSGLGTRYGAHRTSSSSSSIQALWEHQRVPWMGPRSSLPALQSYFLPFFNRENGFWGPELDRPQYLGRT